MSTISKPKRRLHNIFHRQSVTIYKNFECQNIMKKSFFDTCVLSPNFSLRIEYSSMN